MQQEFDCYAFLEILCGAGHGVQQMHCLMCKFEYRRRPEPGRVWAQFSPNAILVARVPDVRAIHIEVGLTQQLRTVPWT
jgi:hypothetical protein